MLGKIFTMATQRRSRSTNILHQFYQKREVHNRNKKSMEYLGRGWSALQEVDRVIDYADLHDQRLIPLLRAARENFELALSADSTSVHARYWLGRLHLRYEDTPLACKAVGAALLVEAANMGFKDAQYEVGWWIRKEKPHAKRDQQAMYYIKKASEQLQPDALYLLGIMYLAGDWVPKDVAMAVSYFHKASLKNHTGAAIACGSLLLKGVDIPESILRLSTKKASVNQRLRLGEESRPKDRREMAKEQFEIAARAGCDLGLKWLEILEEEKMLEEEKKLLES